MLELNLYILALASTDLVLSVEPFGKIDKIVMYETSKVSFSMRYKECLFEGISCTTTKKLGDIRLTFQFADQDIWALEVILLIINYMSKNRNILI